MSVAYRMPLAARIAFMRATVGDEPCWVWDGVISDGYGLLTIMRDGKKHKRRIHVAAYEAAVGPVPEGMELDHLCRNRPCFNPRHLEPVTHRENVLRGSGIAAKNAAKTHCPAGHALAGDNIHWQLNRNGRRYRTCRACRRQANREWGRRVKQSAHPDLPATHREPVA